MSALFIISHEICKQKYLAKRPNCIEFIEQIDTMYITLTFQDITKLQCRSSVRGIFYCMHVKHVTIYQYIVINLISLTR